MIKRAKYKWISYGYRVTVKGKRIIKVVPFREEWPKEEKTVDENIIRR